MARAGGVRNGRSRLVRDRMGHGWLVGPQVPPVRDQQVDVAVAVTLGYVTGGVALTLLLHRRGMRQMCAVVRNPVGFAAWVLFTLHLWVPRWDLINRLSRRR